MGAGGKPLGAGWHYRARPPSLTLYVDLVVGAEKLKPIVELKYVAPQPNCRR
jgi:hypothetical protein